MARDGIRDGRRRFPRIELDRTLPLRDVTMGLAMEIVDVSLGGLRTHSPLPLEPGTCHRFQTTIAGEFVSLVAYVIHCRGAAGTRAPYVVGWRWNDDAVTARGIPRLLDHVTSFDSIVTGGQ
jgi:hypothetical protein